jgi:hypothetical protein
MGKDEEEDEKEGKKRETKEQEKKKMRGVRVNVIGQVKMVQP